MRERDLCRSGNGVCLCMFTTTVIKGTRNKMANVRRSLPQLNNSYQLQGRESSAYSSFLTACLSHPSLRVSWDGWVSFLVAMSSHLPPDPCSLDPTLFLSPETKFAHFSHLKADLYVYIFREIWLSVWIFQSVCRSGLEICKLLCYFIRPGRGTHTLDTEHPIRWSDL